MFGIDSSELFIIGLVALLVIGPQRLPMAMRTVGQWVAKGRAMTRHVRSGFDAMVREAELEEMQKAWAKQNEAIMKATEMDPTAFLDPGNPVPDAGAGAGAGADSGASADTVIDADAAMLPPPPLPSDAPAPTAGITAEAAPAKKPRKPRAGKAAANTPDSAPDER